MVGVRTIAALPEHAAELAPLMRAEDLAECIAAGYRDGRAALDEALAHSAHAWAILFDGEVAAMMGVSPSATAPTVALVWALTGRAVDSSKLSFLRESRRLLRGLLWKYTRLVNLVDARYQGALDWLECLGFTIAAPALHPETGAAFCFVSIERR